MDIKEIRKNIITTSSSEFIEEISDYLMNGNFIGKEINNVIDLFATSHNNKEKKNEEDFKYFYDKVAFVDFCKYNNLPKTKLTSKKYLAAAYNPLTHEFSYSSNKFYKEGNTPLNTILVLNVKGGEIYKVLTALYTCLRDNGIDNSITIPSFNRFEEGLTDSVRININAADMEKVVGLIGELPLPIINLMDKPSMLYPRINDYIGYDAEVSLGDEKVRESSIICQLIEDALYYTVLHFLEHDGKELIENGGDTIIKFRKSYLDENKSLKECDLRILQRMVAVDPSNKEIFVSNLKEALLKATGTKSAYITKEDNEEFDDIYGKLDDDSILFESESLEFDVKTPSVEVEEEQTLNTVPMVAPANDLMVQEEQSNDLMVQEDQPTDLMVQDEQSKELLVQEDEKVLTPEEQPKEESLFEQFQKREGSDEAYLDSLLAGVQGGSQESTETTEGPVVEESPAEEMIPEVSPLEGPVVEEAPAEETIQEPIVDTTPVVEDDSKKEDVHFYGESANIGENFVVSSTPAEAAPVENNLQANEESELVRPEDMTEEQKKLVRDTLAELPADDTRFLDELNAVLNKFPEDDANNQANQSGGQLPPEDVLNEEEVQSLASNELDQSMIYERALKYKDLVSDISILNTKVKGTDFTLLDYFDQQQLLSRIDPKASYMIVTDEVYNGKGIVEECIIKYVSNYGNVPLDKIFEEYGIELLETPGRKDKPKGLLGLFKKKRS